MFFSVGGSYSHFDKSTTGRVTFAIPSLCVWFHLSVQDEVEKKLSQMILDKILHGE